MLFNSLEFVIFLPIMIIFNYLLPHKYRWILLLAGSYYFYMCANPYYIFILLFSTVADYVLAIKLDNEQRYPLRKLYLILSLSVNLGLLFIFKYYNFLNNTLDTGFSMLGLSFEINDLSLLLPVGISFYTFQTISYTIDVYRGKRKAERHFGYFALYVSFFPQLVAGPIERSSRLIPQLKKERTFNYNQTVEGAIRILFGFFKKLVIADSIALIVNNAYSNPAAFNGFQLVVAVYLFGIQLYCDFSAYSDIAIGSAKILGVNLMENFKRPFFSKSTADFWSRWHISLSSWLRDYLTLPLLQASKNKGPFMKNYVVIITFVLCGLWHGANWTFVFWGLIQGIYLITGKITLNLRKKIHKKLLLHKIPRLHNFMKIITTINLIMLSTIFFRASTIYDGFYILTHLWFNIFELFNPSFIYRSMIELGADWYSILSIFVFITIFFSIEYHLEFNNKPKKISSYKKPMRWILYITLVVVVLLFGNFSNNMFIYFVF